MLRALLCALAVVFASCSAPRPAEHDAILRGGRIVDGTGGPSFTGDVVIDKDRITLVGDAGDASARLDLDVHGLAVAPGFVNVLSWASESIYDDPRALSDVMQGVTLEVFGEGDSLGPLSPAMKAEMKDHPAAVHGEVPWTTLGEALQWLENQGIGVNVASFVGATTLRVHELGYEDRAPTREELDGMVALAEEAMREGALGVASALIYAPAFYAKTDELIALARAVAPYGGVYASHMRSEGDRLLEAFDELLTIARAAGCPAEIYHLKAAGESNWGKLDELIRRVEAARADGIRVSADMYTYPAAATGLDAAMPPWVQEGGFAQWRDRLMHPDVRARVVEEMRAPSGAWENLYLAAGGPKNVLIVGLRNPDLGARYLGKTLGDVAADLHESPEEAAIDLVVQDGSRVECVYFLMSEENVRKKIRLPWVSFCSDSQGLAPEGKFLRQSTHPRAYGSFARLLGRYVRDEGLISLEEAVRRLSALPCENLSIPDRGRIEAGRIADLVVFDPATIADRATYTEPHQLAVGVHDVFVAGERVIADGVPTGALPGRFVRGPGARQFSDR